MVGAQLIMKQMLLVLCCFVCVQNSFGNTDNELSLFSVSSEKRVVFSQGNVQYHPKKNLWRFAPNQYDVIGITNQKVSPSYNGWVDLFGWGTGDKPVLATGNYKDYSKYVDWGANVSTTSVQWRILTQKEWRYLLLERENASKLLGVGSVAGVMGVFILPDGANSFNSKLDFISLADQDAIKKMTYYSWTNRLVLNKYTSKQWEALESMGVVFLPFAGKRDVQAVEQVGNSGYYWSSDNDPTTLLRSYGLWISNMNINTMQPISKQVGCAVRLVNDVK